MLKSRLILLSVVILATVLLFQLPKAVVQSGESEDKADAISPENPHTSISPDIQKSISEFRQRSLNESSNQKNAIFADSLASLYRIAGKFDSAAWFAEKATEFFNSPEYWIKAADNYYEAYTFAIDEQKQRQLAEKSREFYTKVLAAQPSNLEAKTKMAMTFLSGPNPMQGIAMLREVLEADPENKLAIFNLGMLSIQSRQYDRAVERFEQLLKLEPEHIQGMLLLGVAYFNLGDKEKARENFEKLKKLDKDPAVQATVDSYLRDLKK